MDHKRQKYPWWLRHLTPLAVVVWPWLLLFVVIPICVLVLQFVAWFRG